MHERFASFEKKDEEIQKHRYLQDISSCTGSEKHTILRYAADSFLCDLSSVSKTSKKKVIMQFPKEYRGHGMCTNCWTLFDDSLQGKEDFRVTGTIRSVGVRRPGWWSF